MGIIKILEIVTEHICNYMIYTERKKYIKFFTSLAFVYKSMSLKRFRIEQLCPSTDSSAFQTPRIDNKSTNEQISANWERRGPTQIRQTA